MEQMTLTQLISTLKDKGCYSLSYDLEPEVENNIVRSIKWNNIHVGNLVSECITLSYLLKTDKIDSDDWFREGCETCGHGGGHFANITVTQIGIELIEYSDIELETVKNHNKLIQEQEEKAAKERKEQRDFHKTNILNHLEDINPKLLILSYLETLDLPEYPSPIYFLEKTSKFIKFCQKDLKDIPKEYLEHYELKQLYFTTYTKYCNDAWKNWIKNKTYLEMSNVKS